MYNVLALDIATKTGWACDVDSGVINLSLKRGDSPGMITVRFYSKIKELILLVKPNLIVYEQPGGLHKSSIIHASKMIGVLEILCNEKGIELTSYPATVIKKFATGKGNAGKPIMMKAAMDKWPDVDIIDDNHADALWLLELAKSEL